MRVSRLRSFYHSILSILACSVEVQVLYNTTGRFLRTRLRACLARDECFTFYSVFACRNSQCAGSCAGAESMLTFPRELGTYLGV
jgi:hypothetical protein